MNFVHLGCLGDLEDIEPDFQLEGMILEDGRRKVGSQMSGKFVLQDASRQGHCEVSYFLVIQVSSFHKRAPLVVSRLAKK